MSKPSIRLAESLEVLHQLQTENAVAIRSNDLTRTHRERLVKKESIQVLLDALQEHLEI